MAAGHFEGDTGSMDLRAGGATGQKSPGVEGHVRRHGRPRAPRPAC
ncbi:hypothetical protein [Luteimonas yindakuii]|nr:hypothetical protein [Luteimonas yindakuii]